MYRGVCMPEPKDEKKVTFSQDLPQATAERFHEIAAKLPCLKWQALEAMIWTFGNLPREAQLRAVAGHYDVRELLRIADLIEGQNSARTAAGEDVPVRPRGTRKINQ